MAADGIGLQCPSAQPEMAGAQVIGIVRQTAVGPRVSYVAGAAPVTDDLLQAAAPARPTMVMRFAAACEASQCRHNDGAKCTLATRVLERLAPVSNTLPTCAIRRRCRWFAEQGRSICLNCPQVVTESSRDTVDAALMEGVSAQSAEHRL